MFFMKKSNVIFRDYSSFGYITDNRNFRYKNERSIENCIGDKIISESGSIFFSVLDINPKSIDDIASELIKKFIDVDLDTIKNDAEEFYRILEEDGFVVSGKTQEECNDKCTILYKKSYSFSAEGRVLRPSKNTQDFLEEYFNGKPQLTNVHMEITSRCNERCLHCYIPHENKTKDIETNTLFNILEQCREMKVLHLTISGGEPMLHANFYDFLKKCREYNFSINVLSNLTLLDDKTINEMKKNPLLGVQTSLYSMNPESHDEITQAKGSFEKTKHAILKLAENNIPVQVSCPIIKQNKNSYAEVVEWASKNNIPANSDYVIIGKYDCTTQNLECRLAIDEVKKLIDEKISLDIRYLKNIREDAEKKERANPDDFICSVCNSSICISESGNVYPCAGWQNYVVGNMNETSLNEIWNNSAEVRFLRGLRKRDFPKCIQCADAAFCTMCMVRNANESKTGNMLEINEYFCNIAKYNKEKCFEQYSA